MGLSPLAARYDNLILDLDGTVWVGGELTPGAGEAIAELRDAGKRLAFVTNNPRRTAEDYVRKLWRCGVQAAARDVVTAGGAMQHVLAEQYPGRTAFVIGAEPMLDHVAAAGLRILNGTDLASRAEVVVVSGTEQLVYEDLRNAALAARRGAELIGTSRDPTFPMPDGLWPGTGAILVAIEYASGVTATTIGKPHPQMVLTALDRLGDGSSLLIGDRLDTDVAAAAAAGIDGALVLTGGADRVAAEASEDPRAIAVGDTLADLVRA